MASHRITSLTLTQPDDWHVHLRSDSLLAHVLPFSAQHFGRAIVMPNLQPPVVHTKDAINYRQQIEALLPHNSHFTPLMTLYMTEQTDPKDVRKGYLAGHISAVKLYPAGATTNSSAGVKDIEKIYPVLETMEKIGMPLLVHGEVIDNTIDIFDREAVFIDTLLIPIRQRFPALKVVLEHITTKEAVDYISSCDNHIAATVTPHHLVINRNAMLVGGIQPHYYCLPVAKRELHRLALVKAVTSGDISFFLGTDSAPHLDHAKESHCGCAGIFNVANTLSIVTQVFEQENALDKLEGFTSLHGATFYNLPINSHKIHLKRSNRPLLLPKNIQTEEGIITIFNPKIDLYWHVQH